MNQQKIAKMIMNLDIKPCNKCGHEVFVHVNYYGDKQYRFEVECTNCNMTWLSRIYGGAVKAHYKGIESWNNMPRKSKRNKR